MNDRMSDMDAHRTCSLDGCDNSLHCRGLCNNHYQRWRRHGDPLGGRKPPAIYATAEDAFNAQVERGDDCWTWTGVTSSGYGQLHHVGATRQVHRWAYEHFVGPIPAGMTIDHLCENTLCVRPEHLEPCAGPENTLRSSRNLMAINARKTHCIHGHEFTDENTYTYTWRGTKHRKCRTCSSILDKKRKAARHG